MRRTPDWGARCAARPAVTVSLNGRRGTMERLYSSWLAGSRAPERVSRERIDRPPRFAGNVHIHGPSAKESADAPGISGRLIASTEDPAAA